MNSKIICSNSSIFRRKKRKYLIHLVDNINSNHNKIIISNKYNNTSSNNLTIISAEISSIMIALMITISLNFQIYFQVILSILLKKKILVLYHI